MRKAYILAGTTAVLAACSSTPSETERQDELYLRIEYLRRAFQTAYADHNAVSLDTVERELKGYAKREFELLGRDLQKGSLRQKQLAAFALAFSENKRAQGWLIQAVRDPDPTVRAVSLAALGMLRLSDTSIDLFRRYLHSPDWYVRHGALYGLRFQLKEGETRGLLTEVVRLLRDEQMDVRNEALIVLRRMKTKDAVMPVVEVGLKDESPQVRQNATITLSALGEEAREAVPSLIETLRDHETKVVEAAWVALRRITGNDFDRTYDRWRDWYEQEESKFEYACAEHSDVIRRIPGQCPRCLKKLLRQPRPKEYRCPIHADIVLGREGRCTTCHRRLTPYRSVYRCFKHQDYRSLLPGTCRKETCGRELEEIRKSLVCPDHPDIEAPRGGKCSRCGKDLVEHK